MRALSILKSTAVNGILSKFLFLEGYMTCFIDIHSKNLFQLNRNSKSPAFLQVIVDFPFSEYYLNELQKCNYRHCLSQQAEH